MYGCAVCPHEYFFNSYRKCPKDSVFEPSGKYSCLQIIPVLGQSSLSLASCALSPVQMRDVFFICRSCYSGSQECDGTENILGTVAEQVELYFIKRSTKVTSRVFDVFKARLVHTLNQSSLNPVSWALIIPLLSSDTREVF